MSEDNGQAYSAFSATLRIRGANLDLDGITQSMGLQPTHTHRVGESSRTWKTRAFIDDAWHYSAGLPDTASPDAHLQTLWADIAVSRDCLVAMKAVHEIDIFCGYRSDSDHTTFEIQPISFRIFSELGLPCVFSVIVI